MIDMRCGIRIITNQGEVTSLPFKKTVLALGTFDGVHTAHKALLECAVNLANSKGIACGAWCFSQNPAAVLKKSPAQMLMTPRRKVEALLSCGIDFVAIADFEQFRDMPCEDFVEDILKGELGCTGAVCGFNHRFGKGGLGDPLLLRMSFGEENTVVLPKFENRGETVSSSAIREHILNGEIERAYELLGRAFSLCGTVISGKKLGRSLGFPTANLTFPDGYVIPKLGIYATRCILDNREEYIAVSNIGLRPTVEDRAVIPNCETYLIGYFGDLYGREICVEFHTYLRQEMKFSSTEELSAAIECDRRRAEEYFLSKKLIGRDTD